MKKKRKSTRETAEAFAEYHLYDDALIFLDHLNDGGAISAKDIAGPLNVAVHGAVRLYIEVYQPRSFDKLTRHGWLAHGLHIKHKRTGLVRMRERGKESYGENHYHCVFCREDLATFGWNDGVHQLPPAFVNKLYTHTHWCAMQFVKRFVEGNDEGYKLAYHPAPERGRKRGTTAHMLEMKLVDDRRILAEVRAEQLKAVMPLDESLKFDTFTEGRNS